MTGFDITSILDFKPPTYICAACRGLFRHLKTTQDANGQTDWNKCPVCEIEYLSGEYADPKRDSAPIYLRDNGYTIAYGNSLFEHAVTLATLIKKSREIPALPWPTMRLFFEALSRAEHFVHFASWGISHQMIGALKLTSMRVPVFGVVSNVEGHARHELSEFPDECPQFITKVVSTTVGAWDAPHQKLLVIDGLLAFKGSTNLTNSALRKADRGLDVSEVVTNFAEVTTLNNRYFAPVWKRLTFGDDQHFMMYDDAPF